MKVFMLLAEGFEEIEAITVIDILRRADIEIVVAGLKNGLVEGSHKIKVMPDTSMDAIKASEFDGIILPGGFPGYVNLGKDDQVLSILRQMDKDGKYVAAICCAPYTLLKAEILHGRRATINPSGKYKLAASTS
jgi:4-methyl-5(b-hydroxyethyl)-thiazole monophosphate biosynthesis